MKLRLLSAFALLVIAPGLAPAAPIVANSKIVSATVYGAGALVTREAEVDLPVGVLEIVFTGLPESLDPDLLQVSGSGSAQATILDVRAVDAQLEAPANARLKELQAQAKAIQTELRTLEDRTTVLKAQRDYLERIKQATVAPRGDEDNPPALPPVSVWEQFIRFYTDGLTQVLAAVQEVDGARELAQARLDAVNRQIDELGATESRAVTDVFVRASVGTAGTMRVRLVYSVDDASWRPSYDVRVASADKTIRLDYGATVSQSSGEDWTGVTLVLSTAQPDRSGNPPDLSTWFVDQFVPAPMPAAAPAREQSLQYTTAAEVGYLSGNFAGADSLKDHAFAAHSAALEAGLTSATFTIQHPADIPADNAPHKVAITSAPLTGEINHLAVPKLAELAFLRAAVTNTTEFPLIGGEIALFLDGNFVARSRIKTVAPTEKFVLELGVDDAISVERKLINRLQEDTGLISRRIKVTYDVLITVKNHRATPEKLVVKDQVPVSRNEKIAVTLVEPPDREITRDADGTIRWSLDLQPGETRELPLKISIEHPADMQVSGLE